jgi:hypothetical protein
VLQRNILKINSMGNALEGKIKKNGEEEQYLFSKEKNNEFYNIKEYKIRIGFILDVVRDIIKNIDVNSANVGAIISVGKYKDYQISNFAACIGTQ